MRNKRTRLWRRSLMITILFISFMLLAWVACGVKVFRLGTPLEDAKGETVGEVYFGMGGSMALAVVDGSHPRWFLVGLTEPGSLSMYVGQHAMPWLRVGNVVVVPARLLDFDDLDASESFGHHEVHLTAHEVRFEDLSTAVEHHPVLRFKR